MRRLSGLDTDMLYAETPAMQLQGATLTILDPSTSPAGFDVVRLRETVAARLDRLGPFRQRLVSPALHLDRPLWVDDPDFDLRAHIRAIAVPRPGTPRQVAELVARLLPMPLPRDRPLWQMWVIEGLEHDHVGLFGKVHHALLGGMRATAMFELLYDVGPGLVGRTAPAEPKRPERAPSPFRAAGHAAIELAGTPVRMVRLVAEGARVAARLPRFLASEQRAAAVLPFDAPRTSLNGSLGSARGCAYGTLQLADVKAVKDALDVTVNDVVLAVCGGALRTYLDDRGELPPKALTTSVPVSVPGKAGGNGDAVVGNTLSVLGATLGTDVADPVERLRCVHASTVSAKALHEALGPDLLLRLADTVPPAVVGLAVHTVAASRLASRLRPPFNVIVSNLAGPPATLYSAGARAQAFHVLGPAVEGVSVNITVMSYCDHVDFGVVVSPDLVEDPWQIAEAMPPALAELRSAVDRRTSALGQ